MIPKHVDWMRDTGLSVQRSAELQALDTAIEAYGTASSHRKWLTVREGFQKWKAGRGAGGGDAQIQITNVQVKALEDEFSPKLNTNIESARPFITRVVGKGISLKQLPSHLDDDDDESWLYQATSFRNLATIKTQGLDPARGGQGGAGQLVGSQAFIGESSGWVHAAFYPSAAATYALMRESPETYAQLYPHAAGALKGCVDPNERELNDLAIILRFPQRFSDGWEKDPSHPDDAVRSRKKILPIDIEGLTTEGWVKITDLIGLDQALRLAEGSSAASSSASSSR